MTRTITNPANNSNLVAETIRDELQTLENEIAEIGSAWTSWVPSWTNLTIGNATVDGAYCQIGKLVNFRLMIKLAANSSVSGSVSFTLPVAAVSYPGTATAQVIGSVTIYDVGVAIFKGVIVWGSTTTAIVEVNKTDGTYASNTLLSSTIPMTWTTDDELHIIGCYEAA